MYVFQACVFQCVSNNMASAAAIEEENGTAESTLLISKTLSSL